MVEHASGQLDTEAVVIGAGAAGLAAARSLAARGIAYEHLEKGSMVGGLWRIDNDNGGAAAYETLHLNSSRPRTQFPSLPMPAEWPDYPSHELMARYLQGFADHFGLTDRIRLRTEVVAVQPRPGGGAPGSSGWEVTTGDGAGITTRAVLVANGHHGTPRRLPLADGFDGHRFHAHEYREPSVFAGQRVLVVGVGNSGLDIACDAAPIADRVLLSTRHGVHVIPKYAFGRPVDQLSSPLTARLPFRLERALYEVLVQLSVGRPEDRGLPRPDHRLLGAHPSVSSRLYDHVGHGDIEVVGDLTGVHGTVVRFADGREEEVDVLVEATGYDVSLPFLDAEVLEVRDNVLELYRRVVPVDRPGLFLLGFIQTVGSSVPLLEHQSEWVAEILAGAVSLPSGGTMRRWIEADRRAVSRRYLRSARHTMQVDYWRYIRDLREERSRYAVAGPAGASTARGDAGTGRARGLAAPSLPGARR
ncbi:MAG: flavin-containing monooxygenase [Nitriliruptoraceae bacterium]